MNDPANPECRSTWTRAVVLLLVGSACLVSAAPSRAQEAWLVTYGPGSEVWERFGHNALWLRDAERGLDHVFSFGYFDMGRPGFHLDFARGIMRYHGSASTREREFAFYRMRDRSISAQRLELDRGDVRHLHELLHEAIYPIPQHYDYDYLYNNCSTWLRDLIDEVLDGRLRPQLEARPARLEFRDHVRRFNESRLELHAGLSLLLGPEMDRKRTAWEEAFVPEALARSIGEVNIDGAPLVAETRTFYESERHRAPDRPRGLWWQYALIGALGVVGMVWPARRRASFWRLLPWRTAAVAWTLAGGLVLLMWLATEHAVVAGNLMVLVLNPLWLGLLLPVPAFFRCALWWLVLACLVAATILMSVPDGPQYRGEVLLWIVPMSLAMLWLARCRPAAESGKSAMEGVN